MSEDPVDELYDEVVDQEEGRAETTDRIMERHKGYKEGVESGGDRFDIDITNTFLIGSFTEDPDDGAKEGGNDNEDQSEDGLLRRKFLYCAAGLLGLGGLYGLKEDNPEWQETYQILAQNDLELIAGDMASSNYEELNALGHNLDEALDDHRDVALGLNPEHGDVGVRHNDFEEYTLQERVDLPDAYDRARELSNL